jgi:hypothetical protein
MVIWQREFSVMSQRDYGLQPRVAASATLGKLVRKEISTATRLRHFLQEECNKQTQPRCGRGQDRGWRPLSRWGITENLS